MRIEKTERVWIVFELLVAWLTAKYKKKLTILQYLSIYNKLLIK